MLILHPASHGVVVATQVAIAAFGQNNAIVALHLALLLPFGIANAVFFGVFIGVFAPIFALCLQLVVQIPSRKIIPIGPDRIAQFALDLRTLIHRRRKLGIRLNNHVQIGHCLTQLPHLLMHQRTVVLRHMMLGIQPQHLIKVVNGPIHVAHLSPNQTPVEISQYVVGIQFNDPVKVV